MWQKFLYLGLAGAAGTMARYCFSAMIHKNIATEFPIGTAIVNIVGCLMFGLFWAFAESRFPVNGHVRAAVFIGFFGAFTTFSSFAFETSHLLRQSQWLWFAGNILFQNVTGIIAVTVGLVIGKMI